VASGDSVVGPTARARLHEKPAGTREPLQASRQVMPSPIDRAGRRVLSFFVLVFATTWLFQLPAILARNEQLAGPTDRSMPLVVLGYFAPAIAALVLSTRALGGDGVRALLRPFGLVRGLAGWCLLALGHPAAILIAGMTLAQLLVGPTAGSAFYPPTMAQIAAMIVIPFTEQIPWRGFAYPPLERRFGPFAASLIVGLAWALFHVQKQSLLGGLRVDVALWTVLLMTAGTVVYTWFYRRTGSMLLVVVANAGIYLDNPVQALPASVIPLAVLALGYTVLAVALVRARAPSIAWSAR
jgi:membrane protease YdiL (CAAX protease family)